jgi:hypothetical protein
MASELTFVGAMDKIEKNKKMHRRGKMQKFRI